MIEATDRWMIGLQKMLSEALGNDSQAVKAQGRE